jgi:hypothetical protein
MKSPLTIHSMTVVIPASRQVNRAQFHSATLRANLRETFANNGKDVAV